FRSAEASTSVPLAGIRPRPRTEPHDRRTWALSGRYTTLEGPRSVMNRPADPQVGARPARMAASRSGPRGGILGHAGHWSKSEGTPDATAEDAVRPQRPGEHRLPGGGRRAARPGDRARLHLSSRSVVDDSGD